MPPPLLPPYLSISNEVSGMRIYVCFLTWHPHLSFSDSLKMLQKHLLYILPFCTEGRRHFWSHLCLDDCADQLLIDPRLFNSFPSFLAFPSRKKNMRYTFPIRWDPLLLQTFIYSTSQTFFSSLVKTSSKNLSQFPLIILCGDAPVSPNHLQNHVSHQLSLHCWQNFSMFSVKTVWQKNQFLCN